jgi:hypothetical protein
MVTVMACRFQSAGAPDAPRTTTDAPHPLTDATPDAAGSVPGCANGALPEAFTNPTACQPWGDANMTLAGVTEGSGQLVVMPNSNAVSFGGCTAANSDASTAFGSAGEFVEVAMALTGGPAYTALNAYPTNTGVSSTLDISGGFLKLLSGANSIVAETYEPTSMRWLRLRPVVTGVEGDISADGVTWSAFGVVTGEPPAEILINFGAGTTSGVASPGTAVFENLDTCP